MSPTKNFDQIQRPKFKCTFIPTQRLIMQIPPNNIVTQPFHSWYEDNELKNKTQMNINKQTEKKS